MELHALYIIIVELNANHCNFTHWPRKFARFGGMPPVAKNNPGNGWKSMSFTSFTGNVYFAERATSKTLVKPMVSLVFWRLVEVSDFTQFGETSRTLHNDCENQCKPLKLQPFAPEVHLIGQNATGFQELSWKWVAIYEFHTVYWKCPLCSAWHLKNVG